MWGDMESGAWSGGGGEREEEGGQRDQTCVGDL